MITLSHGCTALAPPEGAKGCTVKPSLHVKGDQREPLREVPHAGSQHVVQYIKRAVNFQFNIQRDFSTLVHRMLKGVICVFDIANNSKYPGSIYPGSTVLNTLVLCHLFRLVPVVCVSCMLACEPL